MLGRGRERSPNAAPRAAYFRQSPQLARAGAARNPHPRPQAGRGATRRSASGGPKQNRRHFRVACSGPSRSATAMWLRKPYSFFAFLAFFFFAVFFLAFFLGAAFFLVAFLFLAGLRFAAFFLFGAAFLAFDFLFAAFLFFGAASVFAAFFLFA